MDINLTGQVAASLTQSWWISIGAGAIGGIVTGGIALIGIKMTQNHDERKEGQNRKSIMLQNKKQIYSELMGLKKSLVATKKSFYASNIQTAYLNYCQEIKSVCDENDPDIFNRYHDEAKLRDNLVLINAENEKNLWKIIGLIQITFSDSAILKNSIINISNTDKELDNLEKEIDEESENDFKNISNEMRSLNVITPLWIQSKKNLLTSWREWKIDESNDKIDALEPKIDDLLNCLKYQIQTEESVIPRLGIRERLLRRIWK